MKALNTLSLDNSSKIGANIRTSQFNLTGYLKTLNDTVIEVLNERLASANSLKGKAKTDAKNKAIASAQDTISIHLTAILEGASDFSIVDGSRVINLDDEMGKAARMTIWGAIRYGISAHKILFVEGMRPQAKQGSNHLILWDKPQIKTVVKTTTPKAEASKPEQSAPKVEEQAPKAEQSAPKVEQSQAPAPKDEQSDLDYLIETAATLNKRDLLKLQAAIAKLLTPAKPATKPAKKAA